MTVARLRSATYDRVRSDDSTSSIDAGRTTLSPFSLQPGLVADCLDLALHATEKLIHHHARGGEQYPLTHARHHPANLAVARDAHPRCRLFVGEGDNHVSLDETRPTGAVDDESITLSGLLRS